jgi:hypothetical protein
MYASVAALLALSASVDAFTIKLTNQCGYQVQMFDSKSVENINSGGSVSRWIAPNSGAHVFRHSTSGQSTLAEFSGDGGMAWFDISIIPTGPKSGVRYSLNSLVLVVTPILTPCVDSPNTVPAWMRVRR